VPLSSSSERVVLTSSADTFSPANVRRFSRSEAPASLRAERHAALPDLFNQSASGVTPLVLGDTRRFSAGRGERPAVGREQQLGGAPTREDF
jgi:hypothetical protein